MVPISQKLILLHPQLGEKKNKMVAKATAALDCGEKEAKETNPFNVFLELVPFLQRVVEFSNGSRALLTQLVLGQNRLISFPTGVVELSS